MRGALLSKERVVRVLRHSRGARRAAIASSLAVLIAIPALIAAVQGSDRSPDGYQDPYHPPPPERTACGDYPVREPCLDLDGVVRYALLKAPTPTAKTVIVDFGGPGSAVLSGEADLTGFAADHPQLSLQYNLLVLEEPWVTHPWEDSGLCKEALSSFYRALRDEADALETRGHAVSERCDLPQHGGDRWGFNQWEYRGYVEKILDRHALNLRGFVGQSWGAVRLRYLPGTQLDFAVLVRPFPVSVEADRLVNARAEAIIDTLPSSIHPVETTALAARSVPVTNFDQLSAVVELGYVDDNYFADNADVVISGENEAEIGRLSDDLWQRYDVDLLSPAKLAQWQEICGVVEGSAYGPDHRPRVDGRDISRIRDVLAAEFAPCADTEADRLPQMGAGDWGTTSRNPPDQPSNCVVTSPLDTVAPQTLAHDAYSFIVDEEVTWVESMERSHSSLDGLTECLGRVLE